MIGPFFLALVFFATLPVFAQDLAPLSVFKDCDVCPEMVVIPPGDFMMGGRTKGYDFPRHKVTFGYAFAVGKFEVTVDEFAQFVDATGAKTGGSCLIRTADFGPEKYKYTGTLDPDPKKSSTRNVVYITDGSFKQPGLKVTGRQPAVCISRDEAKAYLDWLSAKTNRKYRMLSEAEWEYAARASTETTFFWGKKESKACLYANFGDKKSLYQVRVAARCGEKIKPLWSAPVGSYQPNAWGLYDMAGNVQEMVEDCWHDNYIGAPADGSAWMEEKCDYYIARGGDYEHPAIVVRSAERLFYGRSPSRGNVLGFRVAVSLGGSAKLAPARQKQMVCSNPQRGYTFTIDIDKISRGADISGEEKPYKIDNIEEENDGLVVRGKSGAGGPGFVAYVGENKRIELIANGKIIQTYTCK